MRPFLSLLVLCAACGGASSTTSTSSADEAALPPPTSQPEGRLRLGHYSTLDGSDGFVLDRTGEKPLFRRDGTGEIVELEPRSGPRGTTELVANEGEIWIRIGEWGELLYDGPSQHEGVEVARDADATALR